jgi:predicted molibdopterin-dependent oxidoreductase YjgC
VVGSDRIGLAAGPELGAVCKAFGTNGKTAPLARLADLEESDLVVGIGVDLQYSAPVAASAVRRLLIARKAQYVEINPRRTGLSHLAGFRMAPKPGRDAVVLGAALRTIAERGLTSASPSPDVVAGLPDTKEPMFESLCGVTMAEVIRLASLIAGSRRPTFLIGTGLTAQGVEAIESVINLAVAGYFFTADGRYRIMEIPRKANTAGARMFGEPAFTLADFDFAGTDVLLMFLGDDEPLWPEGWLEKARPLVHVSVLAAHKQEACEVAHSVAPVGTWAQRAGTFVNLEGRLQKARQLVERRASVWSDAEILQAVANAMSKSFTPNVAAHMPAGVKVAEGQFVPTAEPAREIITCKSKAQGAGTDA